jgi:hypothetical protein
VSAILTGDKGAILTQKDRQTKTNEMQNFN